MPLRRILPLLALMVSGLIISACQPQQNTGDEAVEGGAVGSGGVPPTPTGPWSPRVPYPAAPDADALWGWLAEEARAAADAAWVPTDTVLPRALASLDYDGYAAIRYRPERAVWNGADTPFRLHLFHRGAGQRNRVALHLVEDGRVARIPFDAGRFRYDPPAGDVADDLPDDPGYAGFRVHYPLNRDGVADEVAVFLGASYFRLLGPGHVHGLSSRGLAVDVADPAGEEFPDFRAFWLVRPAPGEGTLVILGLLDSPSVAGAYRMVLDPGQPDGAGPEGDTRLTVEARLFARRDVGKLGVAPLTSMFLHAPGLGPEHDDFRPRIHDSQGLLVHGGAGEWTWRPLANRPGLRLDSLAAGPAPRGFGLVQRERGFDAYLDLQARYHLRPSEWVRPGEGDWGTGVVELLEIPSLTEFADNVVASWVPDAPFRAGEERRFSYELRTFDDRLPDETLLRVARARQGWDALPGQADPPPRSRRRFVVDFEAPEGPVGATPPEAVLGASPGEISDVGVQPLPDGAGWRVSFRLTPDDEAGADLRLRLVRDGRPASETWLHRWEPEPPR